MHRNKKLNYVYAGVDCHKKSHTLTVINCFMEKLGVITAGNQEKEFAKLLAFVGQFETEGLTAIWGLEDINGLGRRLAQYLVAQQKDVRFVNSTLSAQEAKSKLPSKRMMVTIAFVWQRSCWKGLILFLFPRSRMIPTI